MLDHNFTFPRSALVVQLSTARAGLTYCPEARAFLQADWPIRGQDSLRRDARYQVFRDLRGRGFYLTSAGKFGGDFLVYPGVWTLYSSSSLRVFKVELQPQVDDPLNLDSSFVHIEPNTAEGQTAARMVGVVMTLQSLRCSNVIR